MLNLKQSITRQLNKIYKVSFKEKYKKEIKERILFFVNEKYQNINILNLKNIKNEITIVDNEIKELKKDFFEKYKEELFNSINPLWFLNKETFIPIYSEKMYFQAIMLKSFKEIIEKKIKEKYKTNLIYLNSKYYSFSLRKMLEDFIEKNTEKEFIFIERKQELKELYKWIKEEKELYKGNAIAEEKKNYGFYEEIYNRTEFNNKIEEKIKNIENLDEGNFIVLEKEENKINKYTNQLFNYLYLTLLLKEIEKRQEEII